MSRFVQRTLTVFMGMLLVGTIISCTKTNPSTTATTEPTFPPTTTTTIDCEENPTDPSCNLIPQDLIDSVNIITVNPSVGEKMELSLREKTGEECIATYFNPYDYSQISVSMTFTSPSEKQYTQLAFWYKEYDELVVIGEKIDEDGYLTDGTETVRWLSGGINHYRVRITPDEAGEWNYQLTVRFGEVVFQEKSGSFSVLESTEVNRGFISVDPVNKRSFVFDSGESYIPVGVNLAWWSTSLASHDYDNWFKSLSTNSGNYARIWMANWSFSLHKNSYDNFETRQSIAIRLDHVLDVAKEEDVYIMLTLINHGQFSAITNPEWAENVYNTKNGGMCSIPLQFFTSAEARALYKNELLYIISRYGYSENIFAWELFNEVDWIDGYSMGAGFVTSWHREMAEFLHANDPYDHLVTTSYKYTTGTPAYALDAIDFCAPHSYAYGDVNFYPKLISEMTTIANRYDKPVFMGEIGINWESGDSSYHTDYTGVTILQACWGGILSGSGSANHWWWDSWVEAGDLWYLYKGAGIYAKQMNLAGKTYSQLANNSQVHVSNDKVSIIGYLLSNTVYGYLFNEDWAYWELTPAPITGVTVSIPLTDGSYTMTVYDTISGSVVSTTPISVTGGTCQLSGLTVDKNLAFIIQ